jgi:amino acid transporter
MLRRRLSLLQAVSLNMAMMVGIGPFITIPEFLKKLDGPHVMIGWVLGAMIALADGLVWSELAAAFPGSGGTYHFFEAVYGESRTGRLLKFLFVWQFLFSAPLEVATGAIGLAHYVGYLWPTLKQTAWSWHVSVPNLGSFTWQVKNEQWFAMLVMLAITTLAYRRIEVAGRLMVVLWAGMLATVVVVISSGLANFNAAQAFDFPPGAIQLDHRFVLGLGAAVGIAMYDFFGYYQICYLGDEVDDAPRTIPRAILISVVAVALVYLTMNISILGVLPRSEVIDSTHVASDMMQRLFGAGAARLVTMMIVWTAAASAFAALLGYSRVPYAAARSGHFFHGLARTHPTGEFPHRSLLLIAGLATLACLADLVTVIEALLTSRILIQFVAQIATVFYLRTRPDLLAKLRFRMWFFPLPALVALAGWLFVFGTSRPEIIIYGVGSLAAGGAVFVAWNRVAAK